MASKKNLLTIILVTLIVINIGALITMFMLHKPMPERDRKEMRHHRMAGDFLKEELKLDESQSKKMDQLKAAHCDTLHAWVNKMKEKRNFLTTEMMKQAPDDSLLNRTCDEIGTIYATIRKLNIRHYRDMKSICNQEQQRKLDTVFKGIFCCDDMMFGKFKQKHGGCPLGKKEKHSGCGMENSQ